MRSERHAGDGVSSVDLETARETISYIRDDLATVEGLEAAAAALSRAMAVIDEHRRAAPPLPRQRIALAPRFVKGPFSR